MQSEGVPLSPLANIGHALSFAHTPSRETHEDKKAELFRTLPCRVSMQVAGRVAFLLWGLPKLHMRWGASCKTRYRICKPAPVQPCLLDVSAYRSCLEMHSEEPGLLDELCWVPIPRSYKDKATFVCLTDKVLPSIAEAALAKGSRCIHAWSAGCCAGEEPYTLMLLWRLSLQSRFPDLELQIRATGIDCNQLDPP